MVTSYMRYQYNDIDKEINHEYIHKIIVAIIAMMIYITIIFLIEESTSSTTTLKAYTRTTRGI